MFRRRLQPHDAMLAEVDIPLPEPRAVTPDLRSAMKSLPGVVLVEDM